MKIEEIGKFCKAKGLRLVRKCESDFADVYIAETDLETDKPLEHPWGYYQVAWFTHARPKGGEGQLDIGRYLEFDAMHDSDKNWTPERRQEARLNEAMSDAQGWIEKNVEIGRYARG